jgi:hypothetical protein
MNEAFDRARNFILTNARLLERLLLSVKFERGDSAAVGRAVAAYQNRDRGFGHALEPDIRCSESQALFVEVGLAALRDACRKETELALSVCGYLEAVSNAQGLVQIIDGKALQSPHAPHWTDTGEPGLNPTAGICGLLHYQGVAHPWLDRATQSCLQLLMDAPRLEAHALLSAAQLAENISDEESADRIAHRIASSLPKARFFILHAPVSQYGLTPLHFARTPASRWRQLFTTDQIEGHLADLASKQQADGGWPITWEASGPASTSEWRGKVTLEALCVLNAYGRLDAGDPVSGT